MEYHPTFRKIHQGKAYSIYHYPETGAWVVIEHSDGKFFVKSDIVASFTRREDCIKYIDNL